MMRQMREDGGRIDSYWIFKLNRTHLKGNGNRIHFSAINMDECSAEKARARNPAAADERKRDLKVLNVFFSGTKPDRFIHLFCISNNIPMQKALQPSFHKCFFITGIKIV